MRSFPGAAGRAFDAAYKCHAYGGYEEIIELPAYADYVAQRKRISTSDKAWRWHTRKPASESDLLQAEQELGAKLPKEYRKFLANYGESELQVRLPEDSAELCFYRPTELATQRENLFDFIARDERTRPTLTSASNTVWLRVTCCRSPNPQTTAAAW